MIGVDTNVLVYSHRPESPHHALARRLLHDLAEGTAPWAIPWQCLHEFFGVVTNHRLFSDATPAEYALAQIAAWLASPSLVVLTETTNHWGTLVALIKTGQIVGPKVHDARIAALCLQHGVRELWTADRDFLRFPTLVVRNPLVD